jgi:hypothetical protein
MSCVGDNIENIRDRMKMGDLESEITRNYWKLNGNANP